MTTVIKFVMMATMTMMILLWTFVEKLTAQDGCYFLGQALVVLLL